MTTTLPALTPVQEVRLRILDKEEKDVIRSLYFKELTEAEINIFVMICERTGLSPALRQIYPQKRFDSKSGKSNMIVMTGIDGFRWVGERTGKYCPGRETEFKYDPENRLVSATAYIKKQTMDGTWHEVSATAFFSEYVQMTKDGRPNTFWGKMPHVMLAKCAEALAIRKAFPQHLAGVYSPEEMMQAESEEKPAPVTITPEITVLDPAKENEQIEEVLAQYPDDRDMMNTYIRGYMKHYGKSFEEFRKIYNSHERLMADFNPWKEKKKKQATS